MNYVPFSDRCGNGWFGWEDSCYKLDADVRTDHTLASKQCNNQEAELYVPNSIEEATFVKARRDSLLNLAGFQKSPLSALFTTKTGQFLGLVQICPFNVV